MQDIISRAYDNDSDAQIDLGNCYLNGWNVEIDESKAFSWYVKSANQNNEKAQYNLGMCYENGWGVEVDTKKAFLWFNKSSENGYIQATYRVGLFYLEGIGVEKNHELAFLNIKSASEHNIPQAIYDTGLCYANAWGIQQDIETARKYMIKAAKLDDNGICKYSLGMCYLSGVHVEQNNDKAFYWIEQAALIDYSDAEVTLGDLYYDGIGCKMSKDMAVHCWEIAAGFEIPNAIFKLSCCYETGDCGYKQDDDKSYELCLKAANLGSSDAQVKCAINCISCDEPTSSDYDEAYDWILKAINQNHPYALFLLAGFYLDGIVVEESTAKALELYLEAYDLGIEDAAEYIVFCYKYGGNDLKSNTHKASKLAKEYQIDYNEV